MEREHIEPEGIVKHPAFTSIVTVIDPRKWHFFAGRVAHDDDYQPFAPGDFLAQYRKVMETLDYELRTVGATWEDVVFRRVFTVDVDAFLEASANDPVVRSYFPEKMPPSTLIGVTRLAQPEFLIEIDLMAVTG